MAKDKQIIFSGAKIGLLTVGELVRNVKDHPLFIETPSSYLSHWKLYECHCECGKVKLFSENVLAAGHLRSCGCLKEKKRQEAYERRQADIERKARKREINSQLISAEQRLRNLLSAPVQYRNDELIDKTAAEIRKLRAMKAYANRKP